ncbi:MAG: hypothetical protein JEY91_08560 [Spirochaetaceae bacterium]|nr:hypothetical protein [Spirochaetaceae bacterium]
MNQDELKEWNRLHDEHAVIWRELEQYRTDTIVSRKKGEDNTEAENQIERLSAKLKDIEGKIDDFMREH